MELTFGDKIRNLREEKDISQTELGKKIHMSQRKLSYIECNKCEPSIDDIKILCKFFNVTADYLLGLTKK